MENWGKFWRKMSKLYEMENCGKLDEVVEMMVNWGESGGEMKDLERRYGGNFFDLEFLGF